MTSYLNHDPVDQDARRLATDLAAAYAVQGTSSHKASRGRHLFRKLTRRA